MDFMLLTKGKHLQIYNIGTTQSITVKIWFKNFKNYEKKIIIKTSALKVALRLESQICENKKIRI